MIKRWDDFYINEGVLYMDDDFKEIIRRMSTQNTVAKNLLELDKKNTPSEYSFISVSKDEGYVNFISIDRSMRYADEIWGRRSEIMLNIKDRIRNGSLQDDFMYPILKKKSDNMRIGRFVKSILPKTSDKELEEFVNLYKAITSGVDEFKLVYGEDIRKWYHYESYDEIYGQLGKSCMRHPECQDYMDIYCENPEVCGLLILLAPNGLLKGRALVWKIIPEDILGNSYDTYMDRIYTTQDSLITLFREYGSNHGWLMSGNNVNNMQMIHNNGVVTMNIEVKLEKYKFDYYPYMDTFLNLDPKTGILSNEKDVNNGWILNETDGTYIDMGLIYCSWLDKYIPREDSVVANTGDNIPKDIAVEVTLASNPRNLGIYPEGHYRIIYVPHRNMWIHREDIENVKQGLL